MLWFLSVNVPVERDEEQNDLKQKKWRECSQRYISAWENGEPAL